MGAEQHRTSSPPAGTPPPGQRRPEAAGGTASISVRSLGYAILGCTIVLGMVGGGGLTAPTEAGWAALVIGALSLWAAWLYWRTALSDCDVPGHLLHPFLAAVILILLGHMLAGGNVDLHDGRIKLLAGRDVSVLTRLMAMALLVLLAQDVLSRVQHLRWLLTGLGAVLAIGALLRLATSPPTGGDLAVGLVGFAGVGILLTPCLLPHWPEEHVLPFVRPELRRFGPVVRVSAAAVLVALLLVVHPKGAWAALVACAVVGATTLLSALFLKRHRLLLAMVGAILVAAGAAAALRAGPQTPQWLRHVTALGTGQRPPYPGASGLWVLSASAGWVGTAALVGGMVLALARSLYASRSAAEGDQARAAIWAAVAGLASAAVLAEGGLAVPSVTVAAAIAWGLTPHLMAHRVRRFHGLAVVAAFAAALVVLGLERVMGHTVWSFLADRYGDGLMHFFGAFVLACVLFWQVRCGRWWEALICAVSAAIIAGVGELAQMYLSIRNPEWSDVVWDGLGAAAALGAFLLMHAALWLEGLFPARPKVPIEKYEPWRKLAGPF